jgi:cation transport regulator ChaB
VSDEKENEAEGLRAEIARLRADPEHMRDIENAPPLSAEARSIIALAFGSAQDDYADRARQPGHRGRAGEASESASTRLPHRAQ